MNLLSSFFLDNYRMQERQDSRCTG